MHSRDTLDLFRRYSSWYLFEAFRFQLKAIYKWTFLVAEIRSNAAEYFQRIILRRSDGLATF